MQIKKNRDILFLSLLYLLCILPPRLHADENQIRIVTTTSILADITGAIAGDAAKVDYVASPKRDLHFVTPTPKDVLKVKKADIFIHHGAQAEPWLPSLLNAAGNQKILTGERLIDASQNIALLEVPASVSRLEGDIHAKGNPHYWLDPLNAKAMAVNISEGLSTVFPSKADSFRKKSAEFNRQIDERLAVWQKRLEPYQGEGMVTYHRSWSYFAARFGFRLIGEIEPKPGIPPTGKHLSELMQQMKDQKVKLVIKEPHFEARTPQKVAQGSGAQVVDLVQFVGANAEAKDYFSLVEFNVTQIEKALAKGATS